MMSKQEMSLNVAQLVLPVHDVVDDAFKSRFPDVTFHKVSTADELAGVMPGAEVLFINNQSYTGDVGRVVLEHGHDLKWIQFATVGIDTAIRSGLPTNVLMSNVRGLRTGILAGHAIALMLGVMRGFRPYEKFRQKREWGRLEMFPLILTPEGGTMIVLGLGEIGQEVARKAKAFHMRVIGVSRGSVDDPAIDEVVPREKLHDVLPEADVLVIAMPLDSTTHHYVSAKEFELLKSSAVVVNISRGPVMDEEALIEALNTNRIAGAGLDVTETEPLPPSSPLWDMEKVLLTPHLAGRGGETQKRNLAEIFAENITRYQRGEPLYNQIGRDGAILSN